MLAKMRNMGEACTSANRFHVSGAVADEFASKLAEKMGALKLGRGVDDDTDVGPLIDDTQRGKVSELVQDAIGRGATAVVGGHARDGAGYFYEPTVLTDIPDDAELLQEEIFGPVAPSRASPTRTRPSPPPTTPVWPGRLPSTRAIGALRVCERLRRA